MAVPRDNTKNRFPNTIATKIYSILQDGLKISADITGRFSSL